MAKNNSANIDTTNVKIENDGLRLDHTTIPTAPSSGGHILFNRSVAGRQMTAFIGPSGLDSILQPFLARNKIARRNPAGNSATVGLDGCAAMVATGTATSRNVAATNVFTLMKRLGYVSAGTAGSLAGARQNQVQFLLGNGSGLGGFMMITRFGISDASLVSGARMFVGLRNNGSGFSDVEPSTLTGVIGVGHGASDTNFKIFYGGSAAQTPIDLGSDFPINTNTTPYELALFSPSSLLRTVYWQVTNLATGIRATGMVSGTTTQVPSETTLVTLFNCYRSNGATASAVGIDICSLYMETDI